MTTSPSRQSIPVGHFVFDVDRGAGDSKSDPVLLLHGFPQSAASWTSVAERLGTAGFETVAPNQRGYSPGARPHAVEDYRLSELTDDVLRLCDALNLDRVHLVGHDWGAIVAWHLATLAASRVSSLTAVSVPHPAAFAHAIEHEPDQREKSQYMALLRSDEAEDLLLANDAAALRIGFGDAVPADTIDQHIALLTQPGALTAALNWYRAAGEGWRTIAPVTVPTTFVWGTEDIAVSRAAADACADYVEAPYDFVVLDQVSHWIPEQVPDTLSRLILDRAQSV